MNDNDAQDHLRRVQLQYGLTIQEFNVLQRLMEGFHNKNIAAQLDISIRQVEFLRSNIIQKFNLESMAAVLSQLALN